MKNRGVALVLLMLAVGLAAAIGTIWSQYRQTRQALEFWGPETVRRIEQAPTVELIALGNRPGSGAVSSSERTQEVKSIDISQARGLVNFRRSLLEDVNFEREENSSLVSAIDWNIAVRFSDAETSITLVFDLDRRLIADRTNTAHIGILTQRMAQGLERFFAENLGKTIK